MTTRRIRATPALRRPDPLLPAGGYYASGLTLRQRLGTAGVAGAVVLAELLLAVGVVRPGAHILLLGLAGAVGLALAFAFPFLTICVFLVLIATVLDSALVSVSFGVTASAPEVVLGVLLVVALVRPRRRTLGGAPGVALLVFLGLLVIASVLSVQAGRVDAHTSRDFTLPYSYLLFYFVVVRLVPEPERVRRLLVVAVAFAAVTGAVGALIALSGQGNGTIQRLTGNAVSHDEGLDRVRLPGVALAYGLIWYPILEVVRSREHRGWWIAAIAGMLANILVSANRNMWVGLLFGLALLLLVGGDLTRRRVLGGLVGAAVAIALLVLVGPGKVGVSSATSPLLQRGQTLLNPGQEIQDQSLRDRGTETVAAWRSLQGHFVFGLGVGAPFGITLQRYLPGGRIDVSTQTFLHNQYLYLIVAGGVGALAAFLVFLGVPLVEAWRSRNRDPAVLAIMLGLAMIMLSALVMLTFGDYAFLTLLALMAGSVRVLTRAPSPAPT